MNLCASSPSLITFIVKLCYVILWVSTTYHYYKFAFYESLYILSLYHLSYHKYLNVNLCVHSILYNLDYDKFASCKSVCVHQFVVLWVLVTLRATYVSGEPDCLDSRVHVVLLDPQGILYRRSSVVRPASTLGIHWM